MYPAGQIFHYQPGSGLQEKQMPGMNSNKAYRPKRPSNPGLQARKDWIKERLTASQEKRSPNQAGQNNSGGFAPVGKRQPVHPGDPRRRAKWTNILGFNPNKRLPGGATTLMGFQKPSWKQIKAHKDYEKGRFHPKGGSMSMTATGMGSNRPAGMGQFRAEARHRQEVAKLRQQAGKSVDQARNPRQQGPRTDPERRAAWAKILGYDPNKGGTKMGFQMPTWEQIKADPRYEAGRFHGNKRSGSERADNRQMIKQRDRIKNGIAKSQPNRAFDVVSVKVGPNIGPDGLTPRQKKLRKITGY